MDDSLLAEKTDQAITALNELDTDMWLVFCRETGMIQEPVLPLVLGYDVVWPSMIAFTADGRKIAILGENDADTAKQIGVHEVYEYGESLEPTFREILDEVDPDEIAVNYSRDHKTADGLTHGMYTRLTDHLEGTGYEDTLVSAEAVVGRVRGVKSETERERILRAAELTEDLLAEMQAAWDPEWTEADVAEFLHERIEGRGLETAWSRDYCPAVDAGSEGVFGHTMPGDRRLPPGEVLHFDFGVKYEGYAADIQRLYYYPDEENPEPPADLRAAFDDVRAAVDAGFDALEAGVQGFEVDRAARETLTERGWSEPNHGIGHEVGRNAHDGGTLLGPRWEPYGDAPYTEVRVGEVYTVELGVDTEYGYLGLEEMIEVTADGPEYLIPPQTELRRLDATT